MVSTVTYEPFKFQDTFITLQLKVNVCDTNKLLSLWAGNRNKLFLQLVFKRVVKNTDFKLHGNLVTLHSNMDIIFIVLNANIEITHLVLSTSSE